MATLGVRGPLLPRVTAAGDTTGVTNSTAAFVTASTAIEALGGGYLKVPAGTYKAGALQISQARLV